MKTLRLPCRCGAVEIEARGEPIVQLYCHCLDCQAVHGAAYVAESVYRADAVSVVRGSPTTWMLKRSPRFTCGACGTRMFIDVVAVGLRGINGKLLPDGELQPAFHMNCRSAVLPIRDDLPHYAGLPARFGGTDETVGW
jgi:hypothetical protein